MLHMPCEGLARACPRNTEYHVFVGNFVGNFVENGRNSTKFPTKFPTKFWKKGFWDKLYICMNPTFHDHFSGVAKRYADFRPHYPGELFDYLAGIVPRNSLVWDCACGNGQAALDLAQRF